MIALWWPFIKRLWPILVLFAVGLAIGLYGHGRYVKGFKAGEAAGEARVEARWDVATRQANALAAAAQAAADARIESDRLAAAEVERGLREKLSSADAAGRDLARRLRDYQAATARCRAMPATAATSGQPAGASRESGSDEEIGRAAEEVYAACARDAERLDAFNRWIEATR